MRLISELGKMDNKNKGGVDSADSDENNEADFEKPFDEVLNQAMFLPKNAKAETGRASKLSKGN